MAENKLLYSVEHQVIPSWCYNARKFLDDLISLGEQRTLYGAFESIYQNREEEFPFKAEDFNGMHFKVDDTTFVVLMKMPDPQETPLCHRMYLFVDTETDRRAVYTVEKGIDFPDTREVMFLCHWTPEGEHRNYGSYFSDNMTQQVNLEVRVFYSQFRNLDGVRIPMLLGVNPDGTEGIRCKNCGLDLLYDTSGIRQDDKTLVLCPKCFRIDIV